MKYEHLLLGSAFVPLDCQPNSSGKVQELDPCCLKLKGYVVAQGIRRTYYNFLAVKVLKCHYSAELSIFLSRKKKSCKFKSVLIICKRIAHYSIYST